MRPLIAKFAGIVLSVLATQTLSACAGVHLHNVGNAEQAEIASASFAASAKVEADNFAAQAKTFDALAAIDRDSAERYADEMRRSRLAQVAGSTEPLKKIWLNGMFAPRLRDLGVLRGGGTSLSEIRKALVDARPNDISNAESDLRAFEKTKGTILDEFGKLEAVPKPGEKPKPVKCTKDEAPPPEVDASGLSADQAAKLRDLYETLVSNCKDYRDALANYPDWYKEQRKPLDEIRKQRETARALQEAAAKQVAEATAAVKAVQGEADAPLAGSRLKEIAERTRSLLENATGFEKAIFHEATLEAALKCINEGLSAVAGAPAEAKDPCLSDDATAVAAAVPSLINTAQSIEVELNRPNIAGLQIVKQVLEGQLAAAKALVSLEDNKLKLEEAAIKGRVDEVRAYLGLVRKDLEEQTLDQPAIGAGDVTTAIVAAQITRNASAEQQELELEYARIALIYGYALEVSQANAQSWRGLIEPLIAQQKAFHDSGIKPKELADLLFQIGQLIALTNIADQIGK